MNRILNALNLPAFALLASAALLSACGGGGGEPVAGQTPPAPAAFAAPSEPARPDPTKPSVALGAVVPIPGNAVLDSSFEEFPSASWRRILLANEEPDSVLIAPFSDFAANSGIFYARLGSKASQTDRLVQTVLVPNSAESAALQFWYQVRTDEAKSSVEYDRLLVSVDGTFFLNNSSALFVLSNRNGDTNGWVQSPKLDLRAFVGQTITLVFSSLQDSSLPTRFYIDDVSIVPTNPGAGQPETGWWLNPAEPGTGFAIEKQGDKIFMAGFFYTSTGVPVWNVALLSKQGNGSFQGSFDGYTGGSSFAQTFKAATLTSKPALVSANFNARDSGTLTVRESFGNNSRTFAIERFAFAPGKPASTANWKNGWWLNPAEPGSGYFLEAQGNQTFNGAFTYLNDGRPFWFVGSASFGPLQSFNGPWDQYSGGQELLGPFKPASKLPFNTDFYSLSFQSPTSATFSVTGAAAPKTLTRFVFN